MISLKEVLLAEESITENPDKFLREAEMLMMKRVLPALENFEKACALIEKRIGNALFPGFKAAMHDAIKASLKMKRNKVLDTDTIEREMVDYFDR
tara:strand:- start:1512 stop:1796 length:285 start_codon:yes stop_codon:yes gene_type:complete